MTRDVVLALGLLLSTASQLRPAGAAIGLGEICLAIWLILMLGRETSRLGPPITPALSRLLIFWTLFAIAQSLGTLTGLAIGDVHDPALFLHDVVAYPLVAAVSCLSVVEPAAGPRLQRVAWLLATLGAVLLALQLAHAGGLVDIPSIDPWFWDRLRGWSANPNQLALFCAVLGLLSLHLADVAARPGERIAAVACVILAIYVGRLTKSDTFSFVLVSAGPILVALKLRTWLLSRERRLTLRSASAWIVLLALPAFLAAVAPLGDSIAVQAESLAEDMTKGKTQDTERTAQLRYHSWGEAINRGLESGMLGLGPGPHLEIPPATVAARLSTSNEPKYVENPPLNSTPNFEAHNTLLDLFTQGGLIAVLSFVWLAATTLLLTYRARLDALTTLLCGLAIFSTFHLIVRHPIFWFAIAFCLVAGTEARGVSATQARGSQLLARIEP
jgi:O-Antigen ligase